MAAAGSSSKMVSYESAASEAVEFHYDHMTKGRNDHFDFRMFANQDLDEIIRYMRYFDEHHPDESGNFFFHSHKDTCYCGCISYSVPFTYIVYLKMDQIEFLQSVGAFDLKNTSQIGPFIQKWSQRCGSYLGDTKILLNITRVFQIIERFCNHDEIVAYRFVDDELPWLSLSVIEMLYEGDRSSFKMPEIIRKMSDWGVSIPEQHDLFNDIMYADDTFSCQTMLSLGYDPSHFHEYSRSDPDGIIDSAFKTFRRIMEPYLIATKEQFLIDYPSFGFCRSKSEWREIIQRETKNRTDSRRRYGVSSTYNTLSLIVQSGFDPTKVLAGSPADSPTSLLDLMKQARTILDSEIENYKWDVWIMTVFEHRSTTLV